MQLKKCSEVVVETEAKSSSSSIQTLGHLLMNYGPVASSRRWKEERKIND